MVLNSLETRNAIQRAIKNVTGINASYRKNEGTTYPRSTFFEVVRQPVTASNRRYARLITYQVSIFSKSDMATKMDLLEKALGEFVGCFVENWREELVDEKSQGILHYAIDFEVFVDG